MRSRALNNLRTNFKCSLKQKAPTRKIVLKQVANKKSPRKYLFKQIDQVHSKLLVERKKHMLKAKQKVTISLFLIVIVKNSSSIAVYHHLHQFLYQSLHCCHLQLVKMLIVVVVLYTLCYFPHNIVWVRIYIYLSKIMLSLRMETKVDSITSIKSCSPHKVC